MMADGGTAPSVSVVIPSKDRHEAVQQAVATALAQTLPPLEVLVVNDGPDAAKHEALARRFAGQPVRYLEAPASGLPSAVRNHGVRHARSDWIGLLDDDDRWLPEKLERQLALARQLGGGDCLIAGRQQVCWPSGKSTLRPRRRALGERRMDRLLFGGGLRPLGGIHISTFLAPRQLFERVPFDETLRHYEDHQWALDAAERVPFAVTAEVVAERHLQPGGGLSSQGALALAWSWYERNRPRLGAEARAGFLARAVSRHAAEEEQWRLLPEIAAEVARTRPLGLGLWPVLLAPWLRRAPRLLTSTGPCP